MNPTILVCVDFDKTLYLSRGAPFGTGGVYYSMVESLEPFGPPGFDNRWVMPTVVEMRRALIDPRAAVVLLSDRPDLAPLRGHMERMLKKAGLTPHVMQLKPIGYPADDPSYKAQVVEKLLAALPEAKRVMMFDDDCDNLSAVQAVVEASERTFVPRLVEL